MNYKPWLKSGNFFLIMFIVMVVGLCLAGKERFDLSDPTPVQQHYAYIYTTYLIIGILLRTVGESLKKE